MNSRVVKFIGGPYDGKIMSVCYPYIYVLEMQPVNTTVFDPLTPIEPIGVIKHLYTLNHYKTEMLWRGPRR